MTASSRRAAHGAAVGSIAMVASSRVIARRNMLPKLSPQLYSTPSTPCSWDACSRAWGVVAISSGHRHCRAVTGGQNLSPITNAGDSRTQYFYVCLTCTSWASRLLSHLAAAISVLRSLYRSVPQRTNFSKLVTHQVREKRHWRRKSNSTSISVASEERGTEHKYKLINVNVVS